MSSRHTAAIGAEPATEPPDEHVWCPDVTVATVVERDGRFLCVEEMVRGELVINQPAGHLEPNESLLDAAVRETLEESCWHVRLTGLIAIYQWVSPRDGRHIVRFTFSGETVEEAVDAKPDRGIVRVLWLRPEELRGGAHRPRSPLVERSIADFRSGGSGLPLSVLHAMPGLVPT